MATATFRFQGELAGFLARERRGGAFAHACARAATVKNAIESLGVPHTEAGRLLVNGIPATLQRIVREGDTIEVFPQRGNAADEAQRFVADAHLGALARFLRMLGFDTRYQNAIDDREIVEIAGRERRVVLTRDRELLKCRNVLRGCFVHALKPEAQLREIAERYSLARHMQPFTLCLHCNARLHPIGRDAATARVPARIVERYQAFARCADCERIYWQGSHWERMRAMLGATLDVVIPGA